METLIDDICKMFGFLLTAFVFSSVLFAIEIDCLRQRVAKLESKLAEKEQIDGNDN